MLKVMTNKAVAADTTLTLAVDPSSTAMDPDDYSIMSADMMMVVIAEGEKMGMTTLMVTPVMDSMDESNETIVLTAWMDDAQVGNATTLTIIDGDSAGSGITAKSSADVEAIFEKAIMEAGGLVAGQNSVFVDMSMLFDMANPDMMVTYTVSSSDAEVLGVYAAATDRGIPRRMSRMSWPRPKERVGRSCLLGQGIAGASCGAVRPAVRDVRSPSGRCLEARVFMPCGYDARRAAVRTTGDREKDSAAPPLHVDRRRT